MKHHSITRSGLPNQMFHKGRFDRGTSRLLIRQRENICRF
jgi:hypothetical protein